MPIGRINNKTAISTARKVWSWFMRPESYPVLRVIWTGLEAPDSSSAKATVQDYLNAFYEGPFNHNQDGPPDADDDAVACSIYAAQAFCRGDAKSARWAANR